MNKLKIKKQLQKLMIRKSIIKKKSINWETLENLDKTIQCLTQYPNDIY